MDNELEMPGTGMRFIGLLTHQQKQAGYFVSQDEDFVWLWKRKDGVQHGHPDIVAVFLYDNCTIKEVRETAEKDNEKRGAKPTELPAQLDIA